MPSVLIVDDLLSIHQMLDAVIQPTGFSTAFATDGELALERYRSETFDLVLADIDMKPMDGIALLKELKQLNPAAVVIIMTAYASTESAVQALKLGAFDYLQKPFRVDELLNTLRRALAFKQQLPAVVSGAPTPDPKKETKPWASLAEHLASQEKLYLRTALAAHGGDRQAAAAALGIDPAKFA